MATGEHIAQACQASPGDRAIPVYEHFMATQADRYSCFAQTMKVCVELTGRTRNADGNLGGFRSPELIEALDDRVVPPEGGATPPPKLVRPIRALPQVAKMAQSRDWLARHAGGELDMPLANSKRGESLKTFLERHTYDTHTRHYNKDDEDDAYERPAQVLDYTRQKGERYAEIAQIEAWSQQIGARLGPQVWNDARKNVFVAEMKALVRSGPEAPPPALTTYGIPED